MSLEVTYCILAVDDESIVYRQLENIIGNSRLPVVLAGTASSGEEALRIASDIQPHICILDINMPGMDGLELGEKLVGILDQKPYIIYLTAYNRFDYAQHAIKLGAIDYVLKPINREELLKAVGKAVNTLQSQRIAVAEQNELKNQLASVMPAIVASDKLSEDNRISQIAEAVRRYVDERYAEKISLSSAADLMCLSPDYLGSIFKSATGVSFRSYLRSVRIAKAKALMSNQSLNLTQIAESVGYPDLNYFSQAFLEETGLRPSEYRGGGRRWAK